MSEQMTIWSFIEATRDRYQWPLREIQDFSDQIEKLGRRLSLRLKFEFDEHLKVEALSYPRDLLERIAAQIGQVPCRNATFKDLSVLIRDIGSELKPGEKREFRPSTFIKRAVELALDSLALPGEKANFPSIKSRVGLALIGAVGKRFGDLRVSSRGRLRHRRYILARDAGRPRVLKFFGVNNGHSTSTLREDLVS